MVIDSKGNLFEDRRKKDRRKEQKDVKEDTNKRKGKDRRNTNNPYKA